MKDKTRGDIKAPAAVDRAQLLKGIGLSVVSAVCFGTVAPLVKIAYERNADVLPLLGARFASAAILLVAYHLFRGRSLAIGRSHIVRLMLLGGIAYAIESALFFKALELAPAGIVSLVFFSYPLITAILAFAFRLEPFRAGTFVALVLGIFGVVAIFNAGPANLAGPLLALAAATVVAAYFIVATIFMRGLEPSVGATWTAVGATITTTLAGIAGGQALPPSAWTAGLALGAVTTVAFTTLYGAMRLIGSSRTAVAQMLEPVVTVVIAALFLGERVTARIAIGALLIISALPILATTGHDKEVPAPPDSL